MKKNEGTNNRTADDAVELPIDGYWTCIPSVQEMLRAA